MLNWIISAVRAAIAVAIEAALPDCVECVVGAHEIGSVLSPLTAVASCLLAGLPAGKGNGKRKSRKAGRRR
jgi:hypothetical protein